MWHMAFCSVLAFALVRGGWVAAEPAITRDVYIEAILPIGALFAVVLWLSNAAYMYLSVSFIRMLKVRATSFQQHLLPVLKHQQVLASRQPVVR